MSLLLQKVTVSLVLLADGEPRSFRERRTRVSERLLVSVPGILPTSNGLSLVPVKTDTTIVPLLTTRSTVLVRVVMRVTHRLSLMSPRRRSLRKFTKYLTVL